MLYRRLELSQKDSTPDLYLPSNQFTDIQDGAPSSDHHHSGPQFPLDVPGESLLHITSYLDPPSLLSLAKVCKILSEHIRLDNTWLRAFATQFLGISPECDVESLEWKGLLFRKDPLQSWREVFTSRYKLLRRWELSGNSTMTHTPLSVIASDSQLRLASTLLPGNPTHWTPLPIPNIATFSVSPGAVTRSYPLANKGANIYAIPELFGVVHASAISAHDGVGKVLLGYPDGKVGLLALQKSMDHANITRHVIPVTSLMDDRHNGPVTSITWDHSSHRKEAARFAVSVAVDGVLKVWDTARNAPSCLWSSSPYYNSPYTLVEPALANHGIVVCGLADGGLAIWTGLYTCLPHPLRPALVGQAPQRLVVPCPAAKADSEGGTLSRVYVDPVRPESNVVHILVAYRSHPNFYRFSVDTHTHRATIAIFGDHPALGLVSCIEPYFAVAPDGDRSFIAVGDTLGCINLYDWSLGLLNDSASDLDSSLQIHGPVHKFEAHPDSGSVTAIAWSGIVLVSGSEAGEIKVWDGINLGFIREFGPRKRQYRRGIGNASDPIERSPEDIVGQISLVGESQAVIFSVGHRIVGWWAGPARRNIRGGVKTRHAAGQAKKAGRAGRASDTLDLKSAITESREIIRDFAILPEGVLERKQNERSQRLELESLGLSEAEAVEYVLMLSRDDHEKSEAGLAARLTGGIEEGVFDADFDLDGSYPSNPVENSSASLPRALSTPSPTNSTASSRSSSRSSFRAYPQAFTRASPSESNTKLQISPRMREEPKEAGPTHSSKREVKAIDHSGGHFPVIPKSRSPTSPGITRRSVSASPTPALSSTSKSPSAWSTPLAMTKSFGSPSGQMNASTSARLGKIKATQRSLDEEEMDADMRFAIELSLAEAVSRGAVDVDEALTSKSFQSPHI